MAGRYKSYPEYRDSGVEWIGKVPADWVIYDGKRIFKNRRELAQPTDEQLAASQKFGVVPQSLMMKLNDSKVMLALKGTSSFRHVEKDDYVISLRSFEGGIEHSDYTGCVSPAYTVLHPLKRVAASYYKHLFKSRPFISALQATTDSLRDGKSITYEQFGAIPLVLPEPSEQKQIARFLDHETGKIDALIEKQQALIALLKEKRQAVISHAVTKGLNPEARMKDSGVEWLGEVPEHWIVGKVSYYTHSLDSMRVPIEASNRGDRQGPYPYYGASGIIDHVDDYLLDEPLVLVCEDGWNLLLRSQYVARTVRGKIWVNNHAHILRSDVIEPELLAFGIEQTPLNLFVTGMRQPKLTADALKSMPVAFPIDKPEQEQIVDFISSTSTQLSLTELRVNQAIELLQERRTALISAAVTGKIDVRDWEPAAEA